jgi:hypothetical protein
MLDAVVVLHRDGRDGGLGMAAKSRYGLDVALYASAAGVVESGYCENWCQSFHGSMIVFLHNKNKLYVLKMTKIFPD